MSFLAKYNEFCKGNEAPPIYHRWAGISALSAIIGRRVWINQGIFTIYPNLYVILVGGPGTGKTTAMSIAKDLVRHTKDIPLASTQITKEALTKLMASDVTGGNLSPLVKSFTRTDNHQIEQFTQMAIFATELTHFIAVNPLGMVDFFTTIYDEMVYEVKTKNKGDDLILGPYITLLACMTPDIMAGYLKANIISGGFARRSIFVWAGDRTGVVPFPEIVPEQLQAWEFMKQWAKQLMNINGPFQWTPEAKQFYADWYTELRTVTIRKANPLLKGYFESKHVQLLKSAMLVALSDSTELVLREAHLKIALGYLDLIERDLHRVFEGSGRNEEAGVAMKVISMLENARTMMPYKQMIAAMYNDADRVTLDKIIHHLVDSGRLLKCDANVQGTLVTYIGTPEGAAEFARRQGKEIRGLPTPAPESSSPGPAQSGDSLTVDLT